MNACYMANSEGQAEEATMLSQKAGREFAGTTERSWIWQLTDLLVNLQCVDKSEAV